MLSSRKAVNFGVYMIEQQTNKQENTVHTAVLQCLTKIIVGVLRGRVCGHACAQGRARLGGGVRRTP